MNVLGQLASDLDGDSLALLWSVRLALLCYLVRLLLLIRGSNRDRVPSRAECWWWGIGCGFYLLHVFVAFDQVHDWSHSAALEHTADETERVTGIGRGEGLWVNYLFTLFWVADVGRLVAARRSGRPTPRRTEWAVQGVFAFIVFNATVVFGPAGYRWLFPVVLAGSAAAWWWRIPDRSQTT